MSTNAERDYPQVEGKLLQAQPFFDMVRLAVKRCLWNIIVTLMQARLEAKEDCVASSK